MGGEGASSERQRFCYKSRYGEPAEMSRRRCNTQIWRKSAFLENCREMMWSLLLLDATFIFTKPLFLFAFSFPVPVIMD